MQYIISTFLFLFVIGAKSQVFIPFSNWQYLANCNPLSYCPTLNLTPAALQGSAGMTTVVDTGGCVDDSFTGVTLPFGFFMNGTSYTNYFVGSNTYITAGAGSNTYNPVKWANPALPKFHLGFGDNNYRRVFRLSGTNFFRIRYEGNAPYNTCPGTPNTIIEFTFYRPTVQYQYVQVVIGTHARTGGLFGAASPTAAYPDASLSPITQNTSYVLFSNNTGLTWRILQGWSITGIGTNL